MKKALLIGLLLTISHLAQSQFITKPLNYPSTDYFPGMMHIIDANHLWLGTLHTGSSGMLGYSMAVHTSNGGDNWIFDSIPMAGTPIVSDVFAWNNNIVYYVFTDNWLNGYIWKTTDGGNTWVNKTTNEFTGGFANFYHGFTADSGIAMGDPTSGYFEIQITNDGGDTWSRVPSTNIPAPLSGETGMNSMYSHVGNTIWFPTTNGRVYKSADHGLHWTVSAVGSSNGFYITAFSNALQGVLLNKLASNSLYITTDGGESWDPYSFSTNYLIADVCPIEGFVGGYTVLLGDLTTNSGTLVFTPDNFANIITIATNLNCSTYTSFKDAANGWIAGPGTQNDDILKFTGLLTSTLHIDQPASKLTIFPNPSHDDALILLPEYSISFNATLQVLDINGHLLQENSLKAESKQVVLHSSAYPSGTYFVRVTNGNSLIAQERWIIQH